MEEAKWCFVPTCLNSTKNTVNKWFVPIPTNAKRREIWFKAVARSYRPDSERITLYCCSDHFNLDEDAGSFFERDGELVVKLKKSIVPRVNTKVGSNVIVISNNSQQAPKGKLAQLVSTKEPPVQPLSDTPEVVSLIDENSSDDDQVDMVKVVTSEPAEPRKALMGQRLGSTKQHLIKSVTGKTPSNQQSSTTKRTPKSKADPSSPSSKGGPTRHANYALFESLRKVIPSISSQQGLTRGQILDEAIEFILQMRSKSDKRQGSMHFIMESNSALEAKIEHLEHLITLHNKNEIVLTKEIIDRRLGAVGVPKPASLQSKPNKAKGKK